MATYVPNATQATEPTESRTVESAALEFRTLKASVTSRVDAVQIELDATQVALDADELRITALEQLAFNGNIPGTVVINNHVATEGQTVFALTVDPITVATVDVFINGVYQNHNSFTVVGATVTLSEGVSAGWTVEIRAGVPLLLGVTTADLVANTPSGTISSTTVQGALNEIVSDLSASSGASLVGYAPGSIGAVSATAAGMFDRMLVNAFNFMTPVQVASVVAANYVQDVTAAVQAAITYCAPLGRILYVPAGGYKISATLVKAQSFYGLTMLGDGYSHTRFKYTTLGAGIPCLRIKGGSGSISGAKIEGIGFDGNATTWAVEIQGQCGQELRRCQFGQNSRGLVLHNFSAGEFTEYCHAVDCDFSSSCITALEYKRTAGNDSFNGSGLAGNCTVNSNASNPIVIVGVGCFVYNAPLSLQLWNPAPTTIVQNLNTTAFNCNWYGSIRLEQNTNMVTLAIDGTIGRSFFVGQVIGLSEYWQRGDMYVCSQFNSSTSGAASPVLVPYTIRQLGLVTGANTVPVNIVASLGSIVNSGSSLMLHINIIGSNYHYSHIAVMTLAQGLGGSDVVTVLATQQAFNTSGWGACTFSVNGSSQLIITNSNPAFSAGVYVGVAQIGGGMWT